MNCATCSYTLTLEHAANYVTHCPLCGGRICPYCLAEGTSVVLPATSRWQSIGMRGTRWYISGCALHCAVQAAADATNFRAERAGEVTQ